MPEAKLRSDNPLPAFVATFSLSITQALAEQLMTALKKLTPVPLTTENLSEVAKQGGIYQLFLDGKSVYIGKSKDALPGRIGNHYRKLSGRSPGLTERMAFRAMYVHEDLDALAPEKMLIRELKRGGEAPWNQNGFGNKDPGRRRDTSVVKAAHFDREYPINLDLALTPTHKKPVITLYDALTAIKSAMPYNLRFPSDGKAAHQSLKEVDVSSELVLDQTRTVEEWLSWAAAHLPDGWMITAFPGYVIAYKEDDPNKYESRQQVWLSKGNGGFIQQRHDPVFDHKGEVTLEDEDETGTGDD